MPCLNRYKCTRICNLYVCGICVIHFPNFKYSWDINIISNLYAEQYGTFFLVKNLMDGIYNSHEAYVHLCLKKYICSQLQCVLLISKVNNLQIYCKQIINSYHTGEELPMCIYYS